jgi:hypothetical protein
VGRRVRNLILVDVMGGRWMASGRFERNHGDLVGLYLYTCWLLILRYHAFCPLRLICRSCDVSALVFHSPY